MQRDDRREDYDAEDLNNPGCNAREHERSFMLREDRRLFGLNDAVLRRRETLTQLTDENRYPQHMGN
jgi:hypothetical protein